MIQGTKCNAIVKSTSHEVSNRNIQNSISLSNCNYRIKKKRRKKKEKKSYTSCVSLSAHIVGLKHYQYYYLLTQDVRLGIYQVLHSSYYRITTNFTSIFITIKYIWQIIFECLSLSHRLIIVFYFFIHCSKSATSNSCENGCKIREN